MEKQSVMLLLDLLANTDRIPHSVAFEGSRRGVGGALLVLKGYLDFVSTVFCKIPLCFHKGSQRKQSTFLFLCV